MQYGKINNDTANDISEVVLDMDEQTTKFWGKLQPSDSDAFDKFNRNFPLSVTDVRVYFKLINEIEDDEFEPSLMASKFTTKAWTKAEDVDG